eukprot:CAMPEP_0170516196 /NCGR_PEP_ID=MMETSP0209-20121228/2486_1 /TAXON_ID=665100 ORGANISM="Litonotus pictus, Strain P1" /NCGR_SAMPLE_ID=MMETSP0209 /ASSEMBLY_ACC=CAM_ASM_000301 /LENGTH=272 /DNA_ID=CAMNT_0010800997 /DNA_START=144 /DNA_END=962 /DNA_ORIENTATION=-
MAVGRLGFNANFIGQVGSDEHGPNVKKVLTENNVKSEDMNIVQGFPTGQAYIFSYPDGNNSIVIVGGANTAWDKNNLGFIDAALKKSSFLLLQREINEEINVYAAKKAKELGVKVVLDVGGQDIPLEKDLLENVSIISPNESELARLLRSPVNLNDESSIKDTCNTVRTNSGNTEIEFLIKLGSEGAMFVDKNNNIIKQKAFKIDTMPILDTTGAGDCFTGAFTGKYAETTSPNIAECLKFATAAAFSSITKYGATMPSLEEAKEVLAKADK